MASTLLNPEDRGKANPVTDINPAGGVLVGGPQYDSNGNLIPSPTGSGSGGNGAGGALPGFGSSPATVANPALAGFEDTSADAAANGFGGTASNVGAGAASTAPAASKGFLGASGLDWLKFAAGIIQSRQKPRFTQVPMSPEQRQVFNFANNRIQGLPDPTGTLYPQAIHNAQASPSLDWNALKAGKVGYTPPQPFDPSSLTSAMQGKPNAGTPGTIPQTDAQQFAQWALKNFGPQVIPLVNGAIQNDPTVLQNGGWQLYTQFKNQSGSSNPTQNPMGQPTQPVTNPIPGGLSGRGY